MSFFYVYELLFIQTTVSGKATYNVGSSDNPEFRLDYHNTESKGYTKRHRPLNLVFSIGFESREETHRNEQKH
ncbi:MAG: GIY-YIG nuclease family protein [Balneolaceae bacterium]|nr:GIY-YIG nuclease family protein [Balneolaceae bacterium]